MKVIKTLFKFYSYSVGTLLIISGIAAIFNRMIENNLEEIIKSEGVKDYVSNQY